MSDLHLDLTQHDRKKADKKSRLDRTNTDESFETANKISERSMDESISLSRFVADDSKTASRKQTDQVCVSVLEEVQIRRERFEADLSIGVERNITDAAIAQERKGRRVTNRSLLDAERKTADQHLTFERKAIDAEIQFSLDLLSQERTSHRKTQKSLVTRDEFLAIVSHDLRNPMSAISMAADLLLEDPSPGSIPQEARQMIGIMRRNANNSLRMIRDLLDVERIACGKLELQCADLYIDDVICELVEMLKDAASAKLISLNVIPSTAKVIATFDGDRILQVLSNLVGNAIKFTPVGGKITIETRQTNKKIMVLVSDTGPGVPEEQRKNIFQRFSQLQSKDRRGLGLGLYISKQIIETHHGNLWVEANEPNGSVFIFSLLP